MRLLLRSVSAGSIQPHWLHRHRYLSGLQVSPAISAFGIPEAIVLGGLRPVASAEGASGGLRDCIDQLFRRAEQGPLSSGEEVQGLVGQSLSLAPGATIQELAELAAAFETLRLRLPLRDMMPTVSALLKSGTIGPEALPAVARIMTATGRANLFYLELFDFAAQHVQSMQAADLATFVYEMGRSGLRSRHLMDAVADVAARSIEQMSLNDLMRAWQGFVRFSKDRRDFYIAACPRILVEVPKLNTTQLILALRVARDLKHFRQFVDLHAALSTQLIRTLDSLTLSEATYCLSHSEFSPRYRAQAQSLVRAVEKKLDRAEDLSSLRVVEVVDAVRCLTSWGLRPGVLNRLDQILVEREVELKYSPNVSLWLKAVEAFAEVQKTDAKWNFVALELAKDKLFLGKVSFFQQSALVVAFSKLRIFDLDAYRNIAELLVADITLFKEIKDLALVLKAYADVGYYNEELFTGAYDLVIQWFEGESLDLAQSVVQTNLLKATWCFVAAGFHRKFEAFAAFLDYAYFQEPAKQSPASQRLLAQIADAVLEEVPDLAAKCQYQEHLTMARSAPSVRKLLMTQPVAEHQLLQDVRATLQDLRWPYEVFSMPDEKSSFYLDINLEPKLKLKVALLVAGNQDLAITGQAVEAIPRESGELALARRLLGHRGWKVGVLQRREWEQCATADQKREYLEALIATTSEGASPRFTAASS